jgi:membrane protease YdiL (CAAX protease family)
MLTPKQSGWFILAWFAFQLVLGLFAGTLGSGASALSQGLLGIAGNLIPVVGAYVFYIVRQGPSPEGFIASKKADKRLCLYAAALGLLVQPAAMLISSLSAIFDSSMIDTINTIAAESPPIAAVIALAVIPAITEELVARGVVLSGFREVSPLKAALVNGLIFGLMHGNLRQFFYAFALGTFIAMLVIRGGNVVYGVILHFVLNASQVTVIPWIMANVNEAELSSGFLLALPLSVWACAVLLKRFGGGEEWRRGKRVRAFSAGLLIYVILSCLIMVSEFL